MQTLIKNCLPLIVAAVVSQAAATEKDWSAPLQVAETLLQAGDYAAARPAYEAQAQRGARLFERAGASMIQLEDQTFPKRCGHLENKSLVSTAEMCGKLRAALDARHSPDTLVLARTDAVAVEGLEAARERAEAYLACGVDALFIEAVNSTADMDTVCKQFASRTPLLANMVEGGKTPVRSARELSERGYRIVIFPGGTARFVSRQLQHYFGSLKEHGTTEPMWPEMNDFNALNGLIGTPELLELSRKYAG